MMHISLTRRQTIMQLGLLGGTGVALTAMSLLGLTGKAVATSLPDYPPNAGSGNHVVILGAGIAGLVCAYELEQAGFDVTLLEARERVGGRAWTVRDGDKIEMVGEETQTARFSKDAYLNAGAARIPSFHQGFLGYAKKLGVPMEVEVNSSRSAYIMGSNGRIIRMRTAVNDIRGAVAELLSKALNQGSLDMALSVEDKRKLLPFLKAYGDLNANFSFGGTERSGFSHPPGAGTRFAEPAPPTPLRDLLSNEMLPAILFEDNLYMQATMFEPVGGMDQVHAAFDRHLRRPAIRRADVFEISQSTRKVTVGYRNKATNTRESIQADYLICTIPFPVMSKIKNNFSPAVKRAITSVSYDEAVKVAFDSRRFWEDDQIYGGISFIGGPTSLVWYPSAGLHSPRGVLVAAYSVGKKAEDFVKRPLPEQIAFARHAVERLHNGHGHDLENGMAINWRKIAYSNGSWPNWNKKPEGYQEEHINTPEFRLLQKPDNRVYFAGSALSQTPGWQEGAIQSAHSQLAALIDRVRARPGSETKRVRAA